MKFLFYIIFLQSSTLFASSLATLTHCIGNEEKNIHEKKIHGPIYKLNQSMIGILVQQPSSIGIKKDDLDYICHQKTNISLRFLEKLLTSHGHLFFVTSPKLELSEYNMTEKSLEEMKNEGYNILLELLNSLQAQSNDPKCIKKMFPDLHELFEKIRYWEADKGLAYILNSKDLLFKVFKTIEKENFQLKKCQSKKQ